MTKVETFYVGKKRGWQPGWYYWFVDANAIPETDPVGPFESDTVARADAKVKP